MSYSYYNGKPHHNLDLGWWLVFPEDQNKVIAYGRFKLYWESVERRNKSYSYESEKEIIMWVSVDDSSYSEFTYNWRYSNKVLCEELDNEIRKVRAVFQKARAQSVAKKNKALKEQLAKKQGISVEELNSRRREKRLAEQEEKKAHSTIKQVDNILKAGPVIKNLYDDLDAFLKHMNNGGQVNITYIGTRLRYFKYVQQILAQWKKIPKTRQR